MYPNFLRDAVYKIQYRGLIQSGVLHQTNIQYTFYTPNRPVIVYKNRNQNMCSSHAVGISSGGVLDLQIKPPNWNEICSYCRSYYSYCW